MSHTGTVKFYNAQKGFGFIVGADGNDYFVHFSQIQKEGFKSLANEEPVQFDLEVNPQTGKQNAVNVTGPNGAPVQGQPPRPKGFGKGQGKGNNNFQQGGFQQFPQQGQFGNGFQQLQQNSGFPQQQFQGGFQQHQQF
jgi:cold shock CspA family protein